MLLGGINMKNMYYICEKIKANYDQSLQYIVYLVSDAAYAYVLDANVPLGTFIFLGGYVPPVS